MTEQLDPETVDEIIDALAAGDDAFAYLLHHRASGGRDLDSSWRAVQELKRALGDSPDQGPKGRRVDPALETVRDYLGIDRSKKKKQLRYVVLAMLVTTLLGGYLLVAEVPRIVANLITLTWPTVEATVTEVRLYSRRITPESSKGPGMVKNYMDLSYEYVVEGQRYTAGSEAVEYVPTFDEALRLGDEIRIWYDPSNPSRQIYDRKTYDRTLRAGCGVVLFVAGGFLALLLFMSRRDVAKLGRQDASAPGQKVCRE